MGTSFLLKKWIKKFIIGNIILGISCAIIGYISYCYAQKYYFKQLEELIVNKYMKGNNEIGAYSFSFDNQKVSLNSPGKYSGNVLGYLAGTHDMVPTEVSKAIGKSDYIIDILHIINELGDKYKYKCWAGTNFLKCTIIKKTKTGFDFIDEHMIGIGFKYDISKDPIYTKREVIGTNPWKTDYDIKENYYLTDFSLCQNYINYLISDKYAGINFDAYENSLLELRMWGKPRDNNRPYFGNSFYELRLDQDGGYSGQTLDRIYGNDFNKLHVTTVTMHYSIQKCDNVMESLLIKIFMRIFLSLFIIYSGYCIIKYHKLKTHYIN